MSFLILFTLLGIAVGSFLNVVIIRLPKEENIAFPPSNCPTCKHPLKWYHNIPLFSWIFLGRKCAFCKKPISSQYIMIEILTGLIFFLSYVHATSIIQAFIFATLFSLLLALSVVDIHYKAVPDSLSIPALFVALFARDFLVSLNDALLLAGAFALLRILVSWAIKKEAMGEADIIIAAIIGAALGVELGVFAIYIAALLALPAFVLVAKRGFELPFIPFLAMGLFIVWANKPFCKEVLEYLYG